MLITLKGGMIYLPKAKPQGAYDAMRFLTTNLIPQVKGIPHYSMSPTPALTKEGIMANKKQTLHKNNSWHNSSKVAQPGQLSLLEDVPAIPVSDVPYVGAYKTCKTCRAGKPVTEYSPGRAHRLGVIGECKKCESARHGAYYKKNAVQLRVNTQNIRAKKLGVPGTLHESDITALLAQSPLCFYCGVDYAALGLNWHLDHVRPLADYKKGDALATNDARNMVVACQCCNLAKKDLSVEQFKSWLRAVQGGNAIREVKAPYAA